MEVHESAAAYGVSRRKWTVSEYHRAVETGVFQPDEKLELIQGDVIEVSPQRGPHACAVDNLAEILRGCFPGSRIRPQLPLQLDSFNEPEPDIAVVRGPLSRYFTNHPGPEDVLLVIEVADTSIRIDRGPKAALYAQFGLPEYWILDLGQGRLEVYREPSSESDGPRYKRIEVLTPEQSVQSLHGSCEISVRQLLPE